MFLQIQNPGIAPVEGFTLLGVSTTRDCGVEGTIGQFGSGTKHAINVLLRAGLRVIAYCGKTRLDFQTRDDEIDDGLTRKRVQRVVCKLGGTSSRTLDLGWVLDFGSIDWTDLGMALREFISNAIDRTLREENDFIPAIQDGRLSVSIVEDSKVRAKDDYTRVFVEVNDVVQRYYGELPRRFLHFSAKPEQVKQAFLPKADRNLNGNDNAVIYRAGVYVREVLESKASSVYDYNFAPHLLAIDECRNSSDYTIRAAVAKLFRKATPTELAPVFQTMIDQKECFEDSLDPYYICPTWDEPKPEQQQSWQKAWESVAADAVMCGPSHTMQEFVERKGHATRQLRSSNIVQAAARFGIKTDGTVLSTMEQKGHEKLPATEAAREAVQIVWGWIVTLEMTNGKDRPPVGCFRDHMDGGSRTLGFCDSTGVYLAEDHASGLTKMVLKTALEECVHWITGATDNSRDFQDYVLRLAVEMAELFVAQ